MPHEISQGPHPNLIVLRMYGDLTLADLSINDELGLGSGKPVYLLLDASEINWSVPENFMDAARNSPYSHPDVKHTSVYLKPSPIAAMAKLIPKLTRQQGKVSTHNTYAEALSHVETLIRQAGL